MALNDQSTIGLANRFGVKVVEQSQYDLGSWQKCEGLDVTWDVPDYRAGDAGNSRWFFPANTKYSTVKLSRAASKDDSAKVRAWLNDNSFKQGTTRGVIVIKLYDSLGVEVLEWELRHALPRQWKVSSHDAGGSAVAIETLEIDHEGFLADDLDYAK